MTLKFDQFLQGGVVVPGDIVVGLRNGLNYQFNSFGGGVTSIIEPVHQIGHGFIKGQLVYLNGAIYTLAIANTIPTAEVVGIVSSVTDANDFTISIIGKVSGLSGLISGRVYYLSDSVPGELSLIEPTTPGFVSKPMLIADSDTSGFFFNMRGKIIPNASFSWEAIDSSIIMVPNTGYYITGGGNILLNMPAIAPAGTTLEIAGFASTSWHIVQHGVQQIHVGIDTSSPGVSGYIESIAPTDCIKLLCVVDDTIWVTLSSIGNITIV